MAGHSKWHNIKHKKAKVDAEKGKIFTKISKEITVSAKHGGGDPSSNISLRILLEKARENNMPKDNIERAIKKGTGQIEGAVYESMTYEGYAPENIAVMVTALTDNKNRTISDLRHTFSKHGGRLVDPGAVSWMFEHKGQIEIDPKGKTEEELLEVLLEADILDIKVLSEDEAILICEINDLDKVCHFIEKNNFVVKSFEPAWVAKDSIVLEGESRDKVLDFLEKVDDLDDVKAVFANLG